MLAVCLVRAGRLAEARPMLLRQRQRTLDEGDESSHDLICLFLAELEWLAGNWDVALEHAREGLEVTEQTGSEVMHAALAVPLALVAGARGQLDAAIRMVSEAGDQAEAIDERSYATYNRHAQGFLELTRGDAGAAARLLAGHSEHGIEGTKRIAFAGDEVEALIRLGALERAGGLVDELLERGTLLQRPPLVAIAARCRALLEGARGQEPDDDALESAVATLTTLGLSFERARTLMVLGEVRRRRKQKRLAREALDEAINAFDSLGAAPWADQARRELARVGGRTRSGNLSATEERVAELVASGRSNKEVAAELFVSVRAVEANLTRIYAKLGVSSRTELARRLSEREEPSADAELLAAEGTESVSS